MPGMKPLQHNVMAALRGCLGLARTSLPVETFAPNGEIAVSLVPDQVAELICGRAVRIDVSAKLAVTLLPIVRDTPWRCTHSEGEEPSHDAH